MPYVGGNQVKVDGTTIELNGSGQLQIVDGGVGTTQLADSSVTDTKLSASVPTIKESTGASVQSTSATMATVATVAVSPTVKTSYDAAISYDNTGTSSTPLYRVGFTDGSSTVYSDEIQPVTNNAGSGVCTFKIMPMPGDAQKCQIVGKFQDSNNKTVIQNGGANGCQNVSLGFNWTAITGIILQHRIANPGTLNTRSFELKENKKL